MTKKRTVHKIRKMEFKKIIIVLPLYIISLYMAGCLGIISGTDIIFIEKRRSFPASLEDANASSDLSVGPAMFFSRRWMSFAGGELQEQPA